MPTWQAVKLGAEYGVATAGICPGMVGMGEIDAKPWLRCGFHQVFRVCLFFFSSRRRHTRFDCDWSSDVCSSDLQGFVDGKPALTFPRHYPTETDGPFPTRGPALRRVLERGRAQFTIFCALCHGDRSEEHTSELQSQSNLVCRLLLEKKKKRTDLY